MVYEDRADEFMMDDAELQSDDHYDEQLADTFREQMPSADNDLEADELLKEETPTSTGSS